MLRFARNDDTYVAIARSGATKQSRSGYARARNRFLARLAGGGGFGGGAPATTEKGALLLMPGGALGGVDTAVMVGVHLLEPLAEAAVALRVAEPSKPVVMAIIYLTEIG